MTTRGQWAADFLRALGNSNPDAKTINFVATWTLGENTYAKFNPLATTQPAPGATNFNYVGVKNYPSHDAGIQATVKTLQNGYYPHILHGLQTNDPEEAGIQATEYATWGTGLGFVALWRTGDHRDETLKSHEGGAVSGSAGFGSGDEQTPESSKPGDEQNIVTRVIGSALETTDQIGLGGEQNPPDVSAPDIAKNISFIALGLLLLAIALFLAFRSFVPVQQVVRTVTG